MGVYAELRGFVLTHRSCGVIRGHREPETPEGYLLKVMCPCGANLHCWLSQDDPEAEQLRSALLAFEE